MTYVLFLLSFLWFLIHANPTVYFGGRPQGLRPNLHPGLYDAHLGQYLRSMEHLMIAAKAAPNNRRVGPIIQQVQDSMGKRP